MGHPIRPAQFLHYKDYPRPNPPDFGSQQWPWNQNYPTESGVLGVFFLLTKFPIQTYQQCRPLKSRSMRLRYFWTTLYTRRVHIPYSGRQAIVFGMDRLRLPPLLAPIIHEICAYLTSYTLQHRRPTPFLKVKVHWLWSKKLLCITETKGFLQYDPPSGDAIPTIWLLLSESCNLFDDSVILTSTWQFWVRPTIQSLHWSNNVGGLSVPWWRPIRKCTLERSGLMLSIQRCPGDKGLLNQSEPRL